MENGIDIKENKIYQLSDRLLDILLKDRSSGKNIIWATDHYAERGYGYGFSDEIKAVLITGRNGNVIKPRTEKSKKEIQSRIKDKAEVFTPSWVCNAQNNLIDTAWFGEESPFNREQEKGWESKGEAIKFPTKEGKTWEDYVVANRLEISCGEAPYLVSRYDTVTGEAIALKERIGLLDRKMRVVGENTKDEAEWYAWAKKAIQSIYGYDWQGDNVLLARENILYTFEDYYNAKFERVPTIEQLEEVAEIISWNIWQMDGLKFVIPNSCQKRKQRQISFLEDEKEEECEGCQQNNRYRHNGIYCYIRDWTTGKKVKFVNVTGGGRNR